MDSPDRNDANADPLCLDLRKVFRPCPLCQAAIEVWEQLGPQAVVCDSCGLSCTIDASPPPMALAATLLEPIVDVSSDVQHWLEHAPKPIRPELTPEGRRARKRRMIAAAATAGAVLLLAMIAGQLGYLTANQRFARRLAEERALAQRNELQLLSVKQRLERERLEAEQRKSAAEREARLMTARYLAAESQDFPAAQRWRRVATAVDAVNSTLIQDGYAAPEAHQSLRDALARVPMAYGIDGGLLRGHRDDILALAASRNGRWLATGSADHSVRLWDLQPGNRHPSSSVLNRHQAAVTHVLFSHDNRWLVTGSNDSTACIWDLAADAKSQHPVILPGRDCPITKMAISPNGRWLAIVFAGVEGGAEAARLWDLSEGPRQARSLELNGQRARIEAIAISPDSRWLAIGVDDTVHLWDLAAEVPAIASVGRQCRHGGVTGTLFTNDGKWLVTAGRDGSTRLWNLTAGDPSTSLRLAGHKSPVQLLRASADSRWLVTAADQSLKAWDLTSLNPATAAVDLTLEANAVAAVFSNNGRWLAAAAADGNVQLWAIGESGPACPAVQLHAGNGASKLAFTPDSRSLAATVKDRSVRLWNVDIHDLVSRAEYAAVARKQSIAYRYLWLDPTQTLAGRVAFERFAASNYALAWRSLHPQRMHLASAIGEATAAVAQRWFEIQPQVVKRIAALDAPVAVEAELPITQAEISAVIEQPGSAKTRYVVPRHATQGNTLRLYVR